MKNKLLNASICMNDLIDQLKAGHYCFNKSEKNGKTYVSLAIWLNDIKDEYGNNASISLAKPKEKKDDKTIYVGNGKFFESGPSEPSESDITNLIDKLPF